MTTTLMLKPDPPGAPELDLAPGEHDTAFPVALGVTDRAHRGTLDVPRGSDSVRTLYAALLANGTVNQEGYMGQFISPRLKAVQIPAGNWDFEVFAEESDPLLDGIIYVGVYRIRGGDVVNIFAPTVHLALLPEIPDAEFDAVGFSHNPGIINLQEGDRLMVELWYHGSGTSAIRRRVGASLSQSSINIPADLSFIDDGPFDFTVYDAYLDTFGVLYQTGDQGGANDQTLPLRPVKSDVGNNPFEQRPEYGEFFAQGDFSHGSGQRFFHREGRDAKKYLLSEGYDISDPGRLSHLYDVAAAVTGIGGGGIGAIEVAGGLVFVIAGSNNVRKSDGTVPGVWSSEDATVAHGGNCMDLAAMGDELYGIFSNGHVHKRDVAGVWSHVLTLGTTGATPKIAYVKDRIVAVSGLTVYEITGTTARALETLPAGWLAEDISEGGDFVYVAAGNATSGLSRILHYGLDDTGTMVKQGSTPMPRNQLAFSLLGYLDVVYIGAGRQTSTGGYDPVLYQGFPSGGGNLKLLKVAEQEGSGATDLGVHALCALGESVVCGWSLAAGATPTSAGPRTGLAIHHLGRDAFAHHLQVPPGVLANPARVLSIIPFKGRLLFTVAADDLRYETLGTYCQEASLISSLADWSNAGLKTWDLIELLHAPATADTAIFLEYSTDDPETAAWTGAIVASQSDTPPVRILASARTFAVRLRSLASTGGAVSPSISSFSVRSTPKPVEPEFVLSRVLRLLPEDRKDENAEPVYLADVEATRAAILDLAYTWLILHEPDADWLVHVEGVEDVMPDEPLLSGTEGESEAEGYLLKLTMVGTRTSP